MYRKRNLVEIETTKTRWCRRSLECIENKIARNNPIRSRKRSLPEWKSIRRGSCEWESGRRQQENMISSVFRVSNTVVNALILDQNWDRALVALVSPNNNKDEYKIWSKNASSIVCSMSMQRAPEAIQWNLLMADNLFKYPHFPSNRMVYLLQRMRCHLSDCRHFQLWSKLDAHIRFSYFMTQSSAASLGLRDHSGHRPQIEFYEFLQLSQWLSAFRAHRNQPIKIALTMADGWVRSLF